MATSRPIQTPGTSTKPQAPDDAQQAAAGNATPLGTAAAALAAVAADTSATADTNPVKLTATLEGTQAEQLAAERAKNAELQRKLEETIAAANAVIAASKAAGVGVTELPAKPNLPTVAEAKADCEARVARGEPVHQVLTTEGHYVHPLAGYQGQTADPVALATMAAAMQAAQRSASAAEAARPKGKGGDMMAEGKAPKDE